MSKPTPTKQELLNELALKTASISTQRSQLLRDARNLEARIASEWNALEETEALGLLNLVQCVKRQLGSLE